MKTPEFPAPSQKQATPPDMGHHTWHNYRWLICALLFAATSINYIDRQILPLLKSTLDIHLNWTNRQFGMVNSAFQGAYAVGLLGFGWFIDRHGTKVGYTVSVIAWSLATIGHALVGSVRGFFIAGLTLGLGEGGNFPSAIKAVALWFPKKERALATSIFNSGTNVGAIIAPALVPLIAARWGWQSAFVVAGVAGFVWLIFWHLFYNAPEKVRRLSAGEIAFIQSDVEEQGLGGKFSWLGLLRYRETWSFIIAKFLTDPVWWFFLIWLPDYFHATRNLDIDNSWIHLVTIYTIVTILSIFGSWMTGYLTKRGWSVSGSRKTGMFIFALCVVPILFATRASDWGAVLLIGLAGAAHQAWSANLFTTVSDMFPKRAVASVVGLGGMAGSVGGMLFPLVTGIMLDTFKSSGNITTGYTILFGICAVAHLAAFALNHLFAPRFEPIQLNLT